MKIIEEKLVCGCKRINKRIRFGFVSTLIELCAPHEQERIDKEEAVRVFATFPDKKSERIYEELENMVDALDSAGVDVSFFPQEARQVLKDMAIKLSKEL